MSWILKAAADEPHILFEDEDLIAVDKPSGWFVHPTPLANGDLTVQDWLQSQLNAPVFTLHRLDRATSGVLLFAKNRETAQKVSEQFRLRQVRKTYQAVVRGWTEPVGVVDSPVSSEMQPLAREAHTQFCTLEHSMHPVAFGRYAHSRFSRVELSPTTGRQHQLRRHMAHIRHPILGDSTYGDNKLNRHMHSQLGWNRLLLFATGLEIQHPREDCPLTLICDIPIITDQEVTHDLEKTAEP